MSDTITTSQLPPVLKGPWPIGSIKFFADAPLDFFEKYIPKYKGIFQVDSLFFKANTDFKLMMIVSHPDYVKHLLQDNNRNYRKSFGYEVMKLLLGKGLLTSEGDFWRKQRRLMQPAFHRERLASFANIMSEECSDLLEKWKALPNHSVINLSHDMMEMTLNIVCRAMFSLDVNDASEVVNREFNIANEKLIKRMMNPLQLPLWVPTSSNRKEKHAYKAIHEVVAAVIEKRRQGGDKRYDDLLAMLMETKDEDTGEMMSDSQIKDEVVTIFLAGHETTAVALTWLFHCLEENPEVESKLLQEAQTVLDGKVATLENIPQLEYTKMVIDETLRLYPPAWIIGRHSYEDDEVGGYSIPKDTNCLIPVYYIHRDETYWPEPLRFIPERFSKENSKNRHKFIYFPFGGGPRQCIGNNFALMEMQLIVPVLLQYFHLQKPRDFKFEQDPLITMRPKPEMLMELIHR